MIRAMISLAILLAGSTAVYAQECTRPMLQAAVESYLAAQASGDISRMSLDAKAKFQENMIPTTKEKGLWNTALPIAHTISIYDVPRCKTFTEVIVTQGGTPTCWAPASRSKAAGSPRSTASSATRTTGSSTPRII
jgi:hypothetical protein